MTNPSSNPRPRWDRAQIRAARQAPLVPILERRRFVLSERGGGNYAVQTFPGLIVKGNYWRWPERNLAGNTIDFLVQVMGLSFDQAMLEISASS